jgi:hypothetical protein
MGNKKLYCVFTILIISIAISCKFEKRIYTQGFYFERNKLKNSLDFNSEHDKTKVSETHENVPHCKTQSDLAQNYNHELKELSQFDDTPDTANVLYKVINNSIKEKKIIIVQTPSRQFLLLAPFYDTLTNALKGTYTELHDSLRYNTNYYKDTMLLLDVKGYDNVGKNVIKIPLNRVNGIPNELNKKAGERSFHKKNNDIIFSIFAFLCLALCIISLFYIGIVGALFLSIVSFLLAILGWSKSNQAPFSNLMLVITMIVFLLISMAFISC